MSISELFLIVPNPVFAGLIWFFVISAIFCLLHVLPMRKYILAFSEVIHNAMRLAANSVKTAEQHLQARNREVLLEAGREASERLIDNVNLLRVENTVVNDLAQYPALQRKLSERIVLIDENYKQSTEVPPDPPGWKQGSRVCSEDRRRR